MTPPGIDDTEEDPTEAQHLGLPHQEAPTCGTVLGFACLLSGGLGPLQQDAFP